MSPVGWTKYFEILNFCYRWVIVQLYILSDLPLLTDKKMLITIFKIFHSLFKPLIILVNYNLNFTRILFLRGILWWHLLKRHIYILLDKQCKISMNKKMLMSEKQMDFMIYLVLCLLFTFFFPFLRENCLFQCRLLRSNSLTHMLYFLFIISMSIHLPNIIYLIALSYFYRSVTSLSKWHFF